MWHKRIIWALVLTFLVALAVPYLAHWGEPRYQGKRISRWLDELNLSITEEGKTVRKEEGEGVRKIGPAGLPWILRKLQSRDSRLKLKLEDWADKQSVVHFNFSDAENERRKAVLAIMILGAQARGVVPELTKLLNDPELTSDAGAALAGIGRDGVPALIGGLTNQNAMVREAALTSLLSMGTNAEPALPAIIAAFQDPTLEVRLAALSAAASVGRNQPDLILPLLIGKFRNGDPVMRRHVPYILSGFGTNHMAEVMPVLLEGLADQNQVVRSASLQVLDRYANQALAAVPKLTEIMVSDPKQGASAASVLRKILGADGIAHIVRSFAAQPSSKEAQFWVVMEDFQRIFRGGTAVPELLALTRDQDERVRVLAVLCLGINCQSSELVVPRLVECLALPDRATRCAAAEALGCFGEAARPAIPALLEIIKRESESGEAHPEGIGYLAKEVEKVDANQRAIMRRYGLSTSAWHPDMLGGTRGASVAGTSFEWALKQIDPEAAKGVGKPP